MLIILIFLCICAKHPFCSDSYCSECLEGFKYSETTCVTNCPESWIQSGSGCKNFDSNAFINITFADFLTFEASSISNFSHPLDLPFSEPLKLGPIPTKERGFYFAATSKLVSKVNWVMGPTFELDMFLRLKGEGEVFSVRNSSVSSLLVKYENGSLKVTILMINEKNTTEYSLIFNENLQQWTIFSFICDLKFDVTRINLGSFQIDIVNSEFFPLPFQNYTIGGGFKGFLYHILLKNSIQFRYDPMADPPICDFNQFYDHSSELCYDCPSSCLDWPWCSRNSCSSCFNEFCSSCNGFGYFNCILCSNGRTAPECQFPINCNQGSLFNCSFCKSGFFNNKGICLHEPFKVNETKSIFLQFENFREIQGDLFQSGKNSETFSPFKEPEHDDPFPVYLRGFYFNYSNFYKSQIEIALNHEFTLSFWTFVEERLLTSLLSGKRIVITGSFSVFLKLSNPEESRWFSLRKPKTEPGKWTYLMMQISFEDSTFTMKSGKNYQFNDFLSVGGYTFYDLPGNLYLGFNEELVFKNVKGFKGFLYQFSLWQHKNVDFSLMSSNCPTQEGLCLWNIGLLKYFNEYENKTLPCDDECKKGCRTWGTCGQCQKVTCDECNDYLGTCLENNFKPCLDGYHLTQSVKCCDLRCADCYGPRYFRCLACESGFFLNGNACVQQCPSFMSLNGQVCLFQEEYPVIDLGFNVNVFEVVDSVNQVKFGSKKELFQNLIPSYQRGFYFSQTSFLKSEEILISYNFTAVFFIKIIKPGNLLSKDDFSLSLDNSNTHIIYNKTKSTSTGSLFNKWTLLDLHVSSDIDGIFLFWQGKKPSTSPNISNPAYLLNNSHSSLTIGSPTDSFTGFIWNFQLFYSSEVSIFQSFNICSSSLQINCVSDCDLLKTFENFECIDCLSSCDQGCRFSNSCSICNDPLCFRCSNYSSCEYCPDNSFKSNISCICFSGYEKNHEGLCVKCQDFFLENFCFPLCPLGFESESFECRERRNDGLAVRVIFDKPSDWFLDQVGGLKTVRREKNSTLVDVVPSYLRGVYFRNSSGEILFPENAENILMFGIRFFFTCWILPEEPDSQLLRKVNKNSDLFEISIFYQVSSLKFFIGGQVVQVESTEEVKIFTWNFLVLSASFLNGNTDFSLYTNGKSSDIVSISSHISDEIGGLLIFSSMTEKSFKGFLYSFEIFVKFPEFSSLFTENCENCSFCPGSGKCIPDCNFSSFSNDSSCSACQETCKDGCRFIQNCSLCLDSNCLSCETFKEKSCLECKSGFELINKTCHSCEKGFYFNGFLKTCEKCEAICETCEGIGKCLTCKNNSVLNESWKCECQEGFYGKNECFRKKFNAVLTLSSENEPELIFTEVLKNDLQVSDISVEISGKVIQVKILKIDGFKFKLNLPSVQVKGNEKLVVKFLKTLVSIKNAILDVMVLEISLYQNSQENIAQSLLAIKKFTKSVFMSSVGTMIGASIVSFDPNSFYTFLNSAELFNYVVLYDVDLDKELETFLVSIQISSQLPSIFDAFPTSCSNLTSKKLNTFGYSCNLITVNSGFYLTLFVFLLLVNGIVFILVILTPKSCSNRLRPLLGYFKYKIYLRFWMQTLFELFFGSIIGFLYSDLSSLSQILNLLLCSLIIVRSRQFFQFLSTFLLIYSIYKRHSTKDFNLIQSVLSKFGLFFEEFRPEKTNQWLFYLFFVIRRFALSVIIVVLPFAVLQLMLSIVMSLAVLLYVHLTDCFQQLRFKRYFTLCEGLVLVFYLVVLVGVSPQLKKEKVIRYLAIAIVMTVLIATIVLSVLGAFVKVWKFYKNRKSGAKVISMEPVFCPEVSFNHERLSVFKMKNSEYSMELSPNDGEKAVQNSVVGFDEASRSCIQSL